MKEVYVGGNRVALGRLKPLGRGGEAEIYALGTDALKIYKTPDHPDYEGSPHEQRGAELRIKTHQQKLRQFPKLPPRVVAPKHLATDQSGRIIAGFTMDYVDGADLLVRFAEPGFHQAGLSNRTVTDVFSKMHGTIQGIHAAGTVIGDFNDLNVPVRIKDSEPFFIDADSFQFGRFLTSAFTVKFVDPLLCDPNLRSPMLAKPHGEMSDWYAYELMLMQSFLCVGPYGGIYRPKDPKKRIPQDARALQRVSVFNGDVKYPLPAAPLKTLPDDLLHRFQLVFEKDVRGEFPLGLLRVLDWKKCPKCGVEYARHACPVCDPNAAAQVKETTLVRGKLTITRTFRRPGATIVYASYQAGALKWVWHENGAYLREGGSTVLSGPLDPQTRFRIQGGATLAAKGNRATVIDPGKPDEGIAVDAFRNIPALDANERHRYWLAGGRLMRDGQFGPEFIGGALADQTFFWTGSKFGFGFYQAGRITVGFVFDAVNPGIYDSVKLPLIRGQLVDSTCFFARDLCWFLWSEQDQGVRVNHCAAIDAKGALLAHESAPEGADDEKAWLASLRGKCALGKSLFVATEDGLVRVACDQGKIAVAEKFADTEPFVSPSSHLFVGAEGIYVVSRQEIILMKLNRS